MYMQYIFMYIQVVYQACHGLTAFYTRLVPPPKLWLPRWQHLCHPSGRMALASGRASKALQPMQCANSRALELQ